MKLIRILKFLYTPPHMPWKPKNKVLRIAISLCGWAVLLLLPLYCFLMTEYIHFANKAKFATFLLERQPVVLFDLGVLYLLWLIVLCVCKKGWLATALYGGLWGAVSVVNYLKYAMTGDYFYPWDMFAQTGNAGELLQFITVPFPLLYICLVLFVAVLAVLVYLSGASVPTRWFIRYPIAVIVAICCLIPVSTPKKITYFLNEYSLYLEDMALQTSNYQNNGFVGAFVVNILSSNVQAPDGYSEDAVQTLMSGLEAQQASESFSAPDIILVLSESFWDPTKLPNTTFSEDPLKNYRTLCAQEGVISGSFYTTGFGGGTVRPEFEVLTGMTTDYLPSGSVPWQYITKPTDSYVSIYKSLGYRTLAVHPYTSSFYSRKAAYPMIGIDSLYFEDELYALGREGALEVHIDGKQISDRTFAEAIQYYMEQDTNGPTFVFGISMENHQPYQNKYKEFAITVENDAFDEPVMESVMNFTQGVSHADACLGALVEYVQSRDRDTILIWFGDHLPTLGSGFGAYQQSGVLDGAATDVFRYLYATPFAVYANFELQESDILRVGSDNEIASYHLLNGVAELIGAPKSAYMAYLGEYYHKDPNYNVRLQREALDAAYVEGHRMLTYDIVAGARYLYRSK